MEAVKRVVAWQLEREMKRRRISRAKLASRMKTSPATLGRLFAPDHSSVTLPLLEQAALALGRKRKIELAQAPWPTPISQEMSPDPYLPDVFYVYYAATDADGKRLAAKDASTRPITFCFNGGPGASAVWLPLGGLGPRRLDLPADGLTPATVARNMRPEFDPSFSNIVGGFSSAVNAYVRGELGYESDHPYHLLAGLPWKWSSFEGRYVSTEDRLARAMKTNPRLRVLVLAARRDLACPEDALRHSLAHLTLPASVRGNITTSRYDSGHMMYLYLPDAEKLRADVLRFLK